MSEVKVNKISPRTNCGTVTVGDAGDSVTVTAGVPVTVNGDLKSNALKAIDGGSIISQCGTNITLGASGDTINLAAGASQTGFGRTGTVDWDTTAKTASFTAVSGNGYFVNTTSGAITVTLPAGSAGDIVSLADYAATWQTNSVIVSPNGTDKIGGTNSTATLSTQGQSVTFIYSDSTQGWLNTMDSTSNVRGLAFIQATGGTITTCGDYKIHTFTAPGTFCISNAGNQPTYQKVDYVVVAGGGGGGHYDYSTGGGGAGGYRESHCATISGCYTASPLASGTSIPVTASPYPITVGAGGALATPGSNSIFSTITSTGGGQGGESSPSNGQPGGSGGGGRSIMDSPITSPGGSGNTPPVSPPQGNPGGQGPPFGRQNGGGGGGGATSSGNAGSVPTAGPGGNGAGTGINPSPSVGTPGPSAPLRYFAGGAGGGSNAGADGGTNTTGGDGGYGGGGDGGARGPGYPTSRASTAGGTNTGGGGGAAGGDSYGGSVGGSGIVIIRYKYQ